MASRLSAALADGRPANRGLSSEHRARLNTLLRHMSERSDGAEAAALVWDDRVAGVPPAVRCYTWGAHGAGQLGHPSAEAHGSPREVDALLGAVGLAGARGPPRALPCAAAPELRESDVAAALDDLVARA